MTRRHGVSLIALFVIGGCSELNSIEQGVCGNGVVEPNEDCDSVLAHCFECSLVCATTEDCAAFGGPGFVCGPDGLCHAPAGSFLHAAQVPIAVDSYRIADTNADGVGDVIAQSGSSVSVLYGDFLGSLSTSATVQSPIAQGPVTFAKLDGDGVPDLLVPTADGIAAFTFEFGVPTPYPFPSLVSGIPGGEPLMTFPIGEQYLGGVDLHPVNGLELVVLEVTGSGERVVGRTAMCNATPTETFSEASSDIAVLDAVTTHAVFTTILSSGRVCAIAIDLKAIQDPIDPFHLTVVTPAVTPMFDPAERGILVRFPGNLCPTWMAQGAGGVLWEFAGKDAGTAIRPCVFDAARALQRQDSTGSPKLDGAPLGFLPLGTPAAPEVAIVLTDGVYLYRPISGAVVQFYVSDRELAGVEMLDLDGDAKLDLVARGVASDDLDLLYQIPLPASVFGFLRVRFDTAGDVSRLLPGDYDGNFRSDIAYVERIDGRDRLMIAYGTSDRPLAGQAVGTFENLFSMIRVEFPDSTDPFGIVADLGVLYGFGAAKQIALLHGSPQRTMQAFFDPRKAIVGPGLPLIKLQVEIGGVIPGHFNGGLGGHDILGLASSTGGSNLYLTPAAPGGELSNGARCGIAPSLVRCASRVDNAEADLCTNFASYLTWPMSGTHDKVIGIDGVGNALTFDPVQAGDCSAPVLMATTSWSAKLELPAPLSSEPRRVRSIAPVGTDSSELAISFAPGRDGDPRDAATRVCSMVSGVAESCDDPAALISMSIGTMVTCSDLASGRATQVSRFGAPPPPVADLFAVCGPPGSRFVYRVSRFADRMQIDELFSIGQGDEIEVGDVNGDSVDDIVVLERGATESTLHVYRQCTSRNAFDCEQAVVQGQGEGTK